MLAKVGCSVTPDSAVDVSLVQQTVRVAAWALGASGTSFSLIKVTYHDDSFAFQSKGGMEISMTC